MKRIPMVVLSSALLLGLAGLTFAQSSDPNAGASAKPNPALDAAREKAKNVSAKERDKIEKRVDEIGKGVDAEAASKGDATVAGRIAAEFGITADALIAERSLYGRGWGELMIANTLLANATTSLTLADIFQMRSEGMGWGQIAHGMGLRLGELVAAVKAENRVATGLAKPDGKPAVIHPASTHAAVGAQAGTRVEHGKGGTSSGVGVGATVNKGQGHGK